MHRLPNSIHTVALGEGQLSSSIILEQKQAHINVTTEMWGPGTPHYSGELGDVDTWDELQVRELVQKLTTACFPHEQNAICLLKSSCTNIRWVS